MGNNLYDSLLLYVVTSGMKYYQYGLIVSYWKRGIVCISIM